MRRMRAGTAESVVRPGGVRERCAGNVVPFARPDAGPRRAQPISEVDLGLRPAPVPSTPARWALFIAASLALHAGVFAAFFRQAPPLASAGEQSISVEIVLGTDAAAGLANKPTQSEAVIEAAAARGEDPELVRPEAARPEFAVGKAATPAEAETASAAQQLTGTVPVLASTAPSAEVTAPENHIAEPPPEAKAVISPPRTRRTVPRQQRNVNVQEIRTRQNRTSRASVASSEIGRGRSDTLTNYRGLVAAQLARNKRFPPEARRTGDEGRAVVSFTIDGGGRVTRVALVRGSGVASLDREAQAMVQRASPFPPPPSQRAMRFTVPVNFNIR